MKKIITEKEKRRLYRKADSYLKTKEYRKARSIYVRILKCAPNDLVSLHDLALIDMLEGKLDLASKNLMKLASESPDFFLAKITLAQVFWNQNEHDTALIYLENCLKETKLPEQRRHILTSLIDKYVEIGNPQHALELITVELSHFGEHIVLLNKAANCCYLLNELDESIALYSRSLDISPKQPEVHINLFNVFFKKKDFSSAQNILEKFHILVPHDEFVYQYNMGKTYSEQCDFSNAISRFEAALEISPDSEDAMTELFRARQNSFNFTDNRGAVEDIVAYVMTNPRRATPGLLFILATADGISLEALHETHRQYGRVRPPKEEHRRHQCSSRTQPLRVGFLSGDYCKHPVSQFFLPLLKALNERGLQTYGYSNTKRVDQVTSVFKNTFSNYRDITGTTDEALQKIIRNDGLDILVDLSGHTTDNRLGVFSFYPAKISCTYLGYLTTTGLSTMDYWILDETVFPEFMEEKLTEKPYRLKRPWIAYPLPTKRPPIPVIQKSLSDTIIFGTANNVIKYSDRAIELFSKVLHAYPNSKFLLKHGNFVNKDCIQGALDAFAKYGIPNTRLIFTGYDPSFEDHIKTLQAIDIALDTTPFNGGTTTCDTLYAGVPVLTLAGNRFISRMSATILHSLGLDEWICATEDEFVAKAVAYAMDIEGRNEFRMTIQQRMEESKLCDVDDLAKCMIEAFHDMLVKAGY